MSEKLKEKYKNLTMKLKLEKEKALLANQERKAKTKAENKIRLTLKRKNDASKMSEYKKVICTEGKDGSVIAHPTVSVSIICNNGNILEEDNQHRFKKPIMNNKTAPIPRSRKVQKKQLPMANKKVVNKKPSKAIKDKIKVCVQSAKVRMTTRDRVRKHRAKLSEEQLKIRRMKDRDYRKHRKEMNLDKPVDMLSMRSRLRIRRQWRKNSRAYRQRKADESSSVQSDGATSLMASDSTQKKRGRKVKAQNRSKMYRDLITAHEELTTTKKKMEKYKKRLQRLGCIQCTPSPGTKVKYMTRGKLLLLK